MLHATILFFVKGIVHLLVVLLDMAYPLSYRRFFVLETIARIPYYSYVSVLNLYQSIGKHPSIALQKLHFKQTINETWHLLIMEELGGGKQWYDRFFARLVGFIYYWFTVFLYIVSPQNAYTMMELIENHAYKTYDAFITLHGASLENTKAGGTAHAYMTCVTDHMDQKAYEGSEGGITLKDVFMLIRNDEGEHSSCMNELSQRQDLHDDYIYFT